MYQVANIILLAQYHFYTSHGNNTEMHCNIWTSYEAKSILKNNLEFNVCVVTSYLHILMLGS